MISNIHDPYASDILGGTYFHCLHDPRPVHLGTKGARLGICIYGPRPHMVVSTFVPVTLDDAPCGLGISLDATRLLRHIGFDIALGLI